MVIVRLFVLSFLVASCANVSKKMQTLKDELSDPKKELDSKIRSAQIQRKLDMQEATGQLELDSVGGVDIMLLRSVQRINDQYDLLIDSALNEYHGSALNVNEDLLTKKKGFLGLFKKDPD